MVDKVSKTEEEDLQGERDWKDGEGQRHRREQDY